MASLRELRVSDVMKRTKQTARKHQRLSEVIGQMKKFGVHEVPVVEKGRLLGLIDLDQLIRSRRVPMSSKVGNVMTTNPTLSPGDSLPSCAKMMIESDFKAIPVTERGKFLGIVSRTDLVARIPGLDEFSSLGLSEIMTFEPTVVQETDTVDHARKKMRDLDERSLPVVDKVGKLTGMIDILSVMGVLERQNLTKRSRSRRVVGDKRRPRPLVRDIMTSRVAAIGRMARLREIIKIMNDTGATSVVITEMDNPVGIISQWDLLEILAGAEPEEGVHIQITGLEREDASVYDAIYWFVQKFIKKIARKVKPNMLNIHGIEHVKDGETVRYTISLRLTTDRKTFQARREGYELFEALEDCLDTIEKVIKKQVSKKKDSRRGRTS